MTLNDSRAVLRFASECSVQGKTHTLLAVGEVCMPKPDFYTSAWHAQYAALKTVIANTLYDWLYDEWNLWAD